MKTIALIEKGNDGKYTVYTPDINHTIIGTGETVAEAKTDFENSVVEMITSYSEMNKPLPKELDSISFEFRYDLASFFNHYPFINLSQFAKIAGINASLMRQYKVGQYISEKQMSKIESTLHMVGNELSSIKLIS